MNGHARTHCASIASTCEFDAAATHEGTMRASAPTQNKPTCRKILSQSVMRIPPFGLVTGNGHLRISTPEWSLAMKRMNLRKTLSAAALLGGPIVAASALAQSQGGNAGSGMMGGNGVGWMGGYGSSWIGGYGGGIWMPVLLVIVVAGLVAWVIAQKKK